MQEQCLSLTWTLLRMSLPVCAEVYLSPHLEELKTFLCYYVEPLTVCTRTHTHPSQIHVHLEPQDVACLEIELW